MADPTPVVASVLVAAPLKRPPGFVTGSGTVDTTPMPLGDRVIHRNLVIRANGSNTGVLCIGNSADDAKEGYILGKGETTPSINVDNLNKVFLVGSAAGQGYSWIAA